MIFFIIPANSMLFLIKTLENPLAISSITPGNSKHPQPPPTSCLFFLWSSALIVKETKQYWLIKAQKTQYNKQVTGSKKDTTGMEKETA